MKVIAYYLPQFHEIPENNEWWGKGFTEWVNVKKAVPFKKGQNQPRIPLNNNYYDLSDVNVMRWQADLAKKYGIYGFCIYHYWFNGKMLLQKPAENLLNNKDININFCFCWANENWTNQWIAGTNQKTLMEQTYGDEDEWRAHLKYFLPFFKDERYIKEQNKPLLVIYRPDLIEKLDAMLGKWNDWIKEYGYDGICYAYQKCDSFDEAVKAFDTVKDTPSIYPNSVQLNGSGEPLLYPRIANMVRECRKRFAMCEFVTNGYLLTDEKIAEILDTDIDMIEMSLTGIKPEVYKNFQGSGVYYEQCEKNIA